VRSAGELRPAAGHQAAGRRSRVSAGLPGRWPQPGLPPAAGRGMPSLARAGARLAVRSRRARRAARPRAPEPASAAPLANPPTAMDTPKQAPGAPDRDPRCRKTVVQPWSPPSFRRRPGPGQGVSGRPPLRGAPSPPAEWCRGI
jgi:hypothetical protein